MKRIPLIALVLLAAAGAANSQTKSNDTITRQIKKARAEKNVTLTWSAAGNTSKLMAVAENFADGEARASGIQAMNFAVGLFYPGQEISSAPDQFKLTFWVLTKKPRFADDHRLTVFLMDEALDLGEARYSAKPRTDMEYLNFEISREALARIAREANVRFRLGPFEYTFTRSQLKIFADLLMLSDPAAK